MFFDNEDDDGEYDSPMAAAARGAMVQKPSPSLLEQCQRSGLVAIQHPQMPYGVGAVAVPPQQEEEKDDDALSLPAALIGIGLLLGVGLWITKKVEGK